MHKKIKTYQRLPNAIYEAVNLQVASWRPGPDGSNVPCTQVHIVWNIPTLTEYTFVMRLKSRAAADDLINALIEHRDFVWPEDNHA